MWGPDVPGEPAEEPPIEPPAEVTPLSICWQWDEGWLTIVVTFAEDMNTGVMPDSSDRWTLTYDEDPLTISDWDWDTNRIFEMESVLAESPNYDVGIAYLLKGDDFISSGGGQVALFSDSEVSPCM